MDRKALPRQPTTDMVEAAYNIILHRQPNTEARAKRLAQAIYQMMWDFAPELKATGLPRRQAQVQEFLFKFMTANRKSPTLEEIRQGCGFHDRSNAVQVIRALERKGIVKRTEEGAHRSLQLLVKPGENLNKK